MKQDHFDSREPFSKGQYLDRQDSLHHPGCREQNDRDRTEAEGQLPIHPGIAPGERRRNKYGNDRELARFDPQIEANQRQRECSASHAKIEERIGETESVNEAENECQYPAAFGKNRTNIVQRGKNDGRGNG